MKTNDARALFEDLHQIMENQLRPYGQYLAMRGAGPGEQRFGVPDIVAVACVLVGWSLVHYVKGFITELAKRHANSLFSSSDDIADLEKRVELLEAALSEGRRAEKSITDASIAILQDIWLHHASLRVDEELLLHKLLEHGLTARQAQKVAKQVSVNVTSLLNGETGKGT